MSFVATLICHPEQPLLSSALVAPLASQIGDGEIHWLKDEIACDVVLNSEMPTSQIREIIEAAIADMPIDYTIVATENRRKKLLLADMDSTMIDQECIDELAAHVGLKDKVAEITSRAMNGELEFEPALRERVGLLKGLNIAIVDQIIKSSISLASGGRTLVRTMRNHGSHTALISGGFTIFSERIAAMIGFDENRANQLLHTDGILTGKVVEPILGSDAKVNAVHELSAKLGISPQACIAVGDGANDLAMLNTAGLGIALHAKPAVAAAAKNRINHADLTALLFVQGYRNTDIEWVDDNA